MLIDEVIIINFIPTLADVSAKRFAGELVLKIKGNELKPIDVNDENSTKHN